MRTGRIIWVAALTLVLDLFVFPWSGEVWNGYQNEPGPKAFQSGPWAWGGCVLAIVGAALSLFARLHTPDPGTRAGRLRASALSLGVLGFTLVVVQAVTESDRSFGLYSGVVASAVVAGLTFIELSFPAITRPKPPRTDRSPAANAPGPPNTLSRVKATVIVVLIGLGVIAMMIGSAISATLSGEGGDANGGVVGVSLVTLLVVLFIWWDRIWRRR